MIMAIGMVNQMVDPRETGVQDHVLDNIDRHQIVAEVGAQVEVYLDPNLHRRDVTIGDTMVAVTTTITSDPDLPFVATIEEMVLCAVIGTAVDVVSFLAPLIDPDLIVHHHETGHHREEIGGDRFLVHLLPAVELVGVIVTILCHQ